MLRASVPDVGVLLERVDEELVDEDSERADLTATLRSRFRAEPGHGVWLEIVHVAGARILEHHVVAPRAAVTVAGVSFVVHARGAVTWQDASLPASLRTSLRGSLQSGESACVPTQNGELWLRFTSAPARLLPAEASRFALVLLLMIACMSAWSAGARTVEPAGAPSAAHVETRRARAQRQRHAARTRRQVHRAARRRAVMRRVRAPRAVRPARRAGPRRTAPSSDGGDGGGDGGDGSDPDSESDSPHARAPLARARGPPAYGDRDLLSQSFVLVCRRKPCWWCRSS